MEKSVAELVRKTENDYIRGTTQLSRYVSHSLSDTLERIDAYNNSVHISGSTDSLGRDKPFFNISTAAVNVWYRATDIDRKDIKVRATKSKDWIDSMIATAFIQDWMRRERFGQFLNEWGRVLAKYGSAVIKFVENKEGLHISVVPWNTVICDPVDFDANPKIEIMELTEAELRRRVTTHGYNKDVVKELIESHNTRETKEKQTVDNKSGFIRLYEIHGEMEKSYLTGKEEDDDVFVQQMHVVSFISTNKGRKTEYKDFSVFSGEEAKDPYMITHLIKEDGRTLAIGAIEHLFEAQWMVNHSMKSIKDTLDLASKIIFQTSDSQFIGRNVLDNIENGEILIHDINQPLTQLNNSAINITSAQNYAVQWKNLGNEINSISESMLGVTPKSGTAWRQTEAILQETHSLFELMVENKALYLENIFRERVIPYIKRRKLKNKDEISGVLKQHDIERIDGIFIKNESVRLANEQLKEMVLNRQTPDRMTQDAMILENQINLKEGMNTLGTQRFFKPDDIDQKTWDEQFKDLEWELEFDISGETRDLQQALTTLNTALKIVATPGFEQNKKAQTIVGKILEMTGTMSPIEYNSIPASPVVQPTGALPEFSQTQ